MKIYQLLEYVFKYNAINRGLKPAKNLSTLVWVTDFEKY